MTVIGYSFAYRSIVYYIVQSSFIQFGGARFWVECLSGVDSLFQSGAWHYLWLYLLRESVRLLPLRLSVLPTVQRKRIFVA